MYLIIFCCAPKVHIQSDCTNAFCTICKISVDFIINDLREKYWVCTRRLSLQLLHVYFISSAFSSSTWLPLFSIWPLCSSPRCQGQCALWSAQAILQLHLFKSSSETRCPWSHPSHWDLYPPPWAHDPHSQSSIRVSVFYSLLTSAGWMSCMFVIVSLNKIKGLRWFNMVPVLVR